MTLMLDEWKAAVLRHTPPVPELMEAGKTALGPAAGAAVGVFGLTLLVLGRRSALAAGALAFLAGVGLANYFRLVFPWWPERQDSGTYLGWHWLPVLLVVALFDGLFARVPSVPGFGGWRLRLGIGFLAALIIVPHDLHGTWPVLMDSWPFPFGARFWPLLAFTLAVALGWAGSERVAAQSTRGAVGFGLAFALFGAGFVLVHAHFARFADALSMAGAALLGIALLAAATRVDVGGAIPGVALLLPSLMLVGATETFSEVPWYAFALAAAPPLTIGLLTLPPLTRLHGFWKWAVFWILCLGPTIAAVALAAARESLPGEEAW